LISRAAKLIKLTWPRSPSPKDQSSPSAEPFCPGGPDFTQDAGAIPVATINCRSPRYITHRPADDNSECMAAEGWEPGPSPVYPARARFRKGISREEPGRFLGGSKAPALPILRATLPLAGVVVAKSVVVCH